MYIFIDEAGRFIPSDKNKVSCVTGLVVPDSQLEDLNSWFLDIEKKHGKLIKGRKLSREIRNKILKELLNFDVFVESTAIDMDLHPIDKTLEEKIKRAFYIENNPLTKNPFLQKMKSDFAKKIRETSNQLYLQGNLMWLLVELVLRHGIIYYSQKRPEELGAFHWIVDPKQPGQVTHFEKLWTDLVLPYLQCQPPLSMIIEHDYKFLERFAVSDADIAALHTDSGKKMTKEDMPLDLKKMITEHLEFPDDQKTVGLRLVDVIANTIFRCLNGKVDSVEHAYLGRLFFLRKPTNCVSLLVLHKISEDKKTDRPYIKILQSLQKANRPIWLD